MDLGLPVTAGFASLYSISLVMMKSGFISKLL
jgi:hypothetical protein